MKTIATTIIALVLALSSVMALCVDNDGGALSYTKSSVTLNAQTYTDFCLKNGSVMEFTCVNDNVTSESMPCLRGCRNGACKPTSGGSSLTSASIAPPVPIESVQVPEFSVIAAGVAFSGASIAYLLMRRRE